LIALIAVAKPDILHGSTEGFEIAVRALHQMGDLFYADFGLRFVITDPSWLAGVFKAVISYKKMDSEVGHYCENGFVDTERLGRDLAQANLVLNAAEFNMIVVLLYEAEFAFPCSSKDSEKLQSLKAPENATKDEHISLVVPTLALMDPSGSFEKQIERLRKGDQVFTRRFVFNFIPGGFAHRFLFRSLFRSKIDAVWQRGALLSYPTGGDQGKETVVLLEMDDTALALSLVIDSAEPLPDLYKDFLQMMNGLLSSEFQGVKWHVECPCQCTQGKGHFVRVDIDCQKLATPPSDLGLRLALSSEGVSQGVLRNAHMLEDVQTSTANATLEGLAKDVREIREGVAGISRKVSIKFANLEGSVKVLTLSVQEMGGNVREIKLSTDEMKGLMFGMLNLLYKRDEGRPSLFVLVPTDKSLYDKFVGYFKSMESTNWVCETDFEMRFLCENPITGAHQVQGADYSEVQLPRQTLLKALPVLRPFYKILAPILGTCNKLAGFDILPIPFAKECGELLSEYVESFGEVLCRVEGMEGNTVLKGALDAPHPDVQDSVFGTDAQRAVEILLANTKPQSVAWKYLQRYRSKKTYQLHWLCTACGNIGEFESLNQPIKLQAPSPPSPHQPSATPKKKSKGFFGGAVKKIGRVFDNNIP